MEERKKKEVIFLKNYFYTCNVLISILTLNLKSGKESNFQK